jgi:stage II sporulation protein D
MMFQGGKGGTMDIGIDQVSVVPIDSTAFLELSGRAWRGALEIVAGSRVPVMPAPHSMTVFNVVGVEDYLKGVVPAEIGRPGEDAMEAIKAQAVAARTYALSRLGHYAGWGYDLEATVEDQVYRGVAGEDPEVSRAIEATRGLVLTHQGVPIDAYYHANCGGMTAFIERVWEKAPQPYLVPVEDSFCRGARNHRWREEWDRAELERNIAAYLDTLVALPEGGFGTLQGLEVSRRSPSGRVEVLRVGTDTGVWEIGRDRIRWALRRGGDPARILPSTRFDIEIERGPLGEIVRVTAEGTGNGHGVGMCQTGAIGMARAGHTWQEILAHYYTGVALAPWPE